VRVVPIISVKRPIRNMTRRISRKKNIRQISSLAVRARDGL
jgi:hypothetical protein